MTTRLAPHHTLQTPTRQSRHGVRPHRSVRALGVALAATALLAACSSDGDGDGGDGGDGGGKPDTPIADLAVDTEDLDGITVVAVPSDSYQQSLEQLKQVLDTMSIEPAECKDAFSLQASMEDAEGLEGRQGQIPGEADSPSAVLSLSVGPHKEGGPDRSELVSRCPEMTVGLAAPDGSNVSYTLHNSTADVQAPEGVDGFAGIMQSSTGDAAAGQNAGSLMLSGTVRELDVIVVLSSTGDITDAQRDKGMEVFNKQVDKIKNAD